MDWPIWNFLTPPSPIFLFTVCIFLKEKPILQRRNGWKKDRAKGTSEGEICDVDRKTHVQITFSIDLWLEMVDGKIVSGYQSNHSARFG